MPREVRRIIFDERDCLQMAVDLLTSRGDNRAIRGLGVEVGSEESGNAFIQLRDRGGKAASEQSTSVLSARDALTAAILFCRSHRVPMPRDARKRLEVFRGRLTLVMDHDFGSGA